MEKQTRTRYLADDVLTLVLEPGGDSELSELEDSEDDIDEEELNLPADPKVGTNDVLSSDKEDESDNDDEESSKFKWRKREPDHIDTTFSGESFSMPPDDADQDVFG